MSGISETEVGSPPEYGGNSITLNPEEMFVASVNSCIVLVFYHFKKKFKVEFTSYHSEAEGICVLLQLLLYEFIVQNIISCTIKPILIL